VNRALAKKVADAVLYEGYMLYPYRPSALKNRQRWTFGILYPPAYHEVHEGTERASMHSECLLKANAGASIQIQLRFLHLLSRQVARASDSSFESVPWLLVDGQRVESWDEGVERVVEFEAPLQDDKPRRMGFSFHGSNEVDRLQTRSGESVGTVTRLQNEIYGTLSAVSRNVGDSVRKLTIDVSNATDLSETTDRDRALLRSMLSAHMILSVASGEFISLLDPPIELRELAGHCSNVGNFPVMIGKEGERDGMLCSPIVLYDYPQIAPESGGDFYDATEMDEMLTLRVMTLTDEEKSEMLLADDHARRLLQRTEETAREQLAKTHGAIRSMRPVIEET